MHLLFAIYLVQYRALNYNLSAISFTGFVYCPCSFAFVIISMLLKFNIVHADFACDLHNLSSLSKEDIEGLINKQL